MQYSNSVAGLKMKYWEILASEIDATGRVLYTADAYRNDGKRFTVIADDKLTAFLELEAVIRAVGL
jgi:hypothetical protein